MVSKKVSKNNKAVYKNRLPHIGGSFLNEPGN